jgi:hypothetical protein
MQSLMKFTFVALIAVFGATLVTPARAQNSNRFVVDIPFDFSVGNTLLKAGNYRVEELQSGILVFNGNDGQDSQYALTVGDEAANKGNQPKLVFARYGDETFLHKVFLSGGDDYRQLLPSSKEKKLIQKRTSGEELSLLVQPAR